MSSNSLWFLVGYFYNVCVATAVLQVSLSWLGKSHCHGWIFWKIPNSHFVSDETVTQIHGSWVRWKYNNCQTNCLINSSSLISVWIFAWFIFLSDFPRPVLNPNLASKFNIAYWPEYIIRSLLFSSSKLCLEKVDVIIYFKAYTECVFFKLKHDMHLKDIKGCLI